ncbi:MAG: hypothetical protein II085_00890, partial [Alphaproteobacteria bacterium]|nr:hypothetical protein [Alphaproteobacteria bacterium]
MSVYDDLISILFKLPDGRNLEEYFKNILLLASLSSEDLKTGVTFPASGVKKYASYDEVAEDFEADSQVAVEAYAIFNQKNNSQTTSQVKYLIVAEKDENDTVEEALDKAKAVDGKFAKVVTTSRDTADLLDVAHWCQVNDRFCDLVVTNVTSLSSLKTNLNNHAYGIFRTNANEPIASALASTSTCGKFGAKDGSAQFTQLIGISPEYYTGEEISDMKANNVAFYTNVSAVDGGQTADLGYNWLIGSKMFGGGLRQREMIKHY